MEKLEEMHSGRYPSGWPTPRVYDDANRDKLDLWQGKFAEVEEAMERAETLWMAAVEKLESAQSQTD